MTHVSEDSTTTHSNPSLPLREKVGYLILSWDARQPSDRTRDEYLALADDIITVVRDG